MLEDSLVWKLKRSEQKQKNENLPSHDLHLGQDVMMQDPASKWRSPAVITRLCEEPRSYQITTSDNVTYRKMQAHLNPYNPEFKNIQDAKAAICGHLQRLVIKLRVMTL